MAPVNGFQVFVVGSNEAGQLGMGGDVGSKGRAATPLLNEALTRLGVVEVACGAAHGLALTLGGEVYSWGCNEAGALGRDTTSHAAVADSIEGDNESGRSPWAPDGGQPTEVRRTRVGTTSAQQEDEQSEDRLNLVEATPARVTGFPPGTKIAQVVASEAASFALTDQGKVFGWGTFRSNEGSLGLVPRSLKLRWDNQWEVGQVIHSSATPGSEGEPSWAPVLLAAFAILKIVKLASAPGANHLLALSDRGVVHAVGTGEQHQLGRRLVERNKANGLVGGAVTFEDEVPGDTNSGEPITATRGAGQGRRTKTKLIMEDIAVGSQTSYAIDIHGRVWSWGQDDFAQLGQDDLREGGGVGSTPTKKKKDSLASHAPRLVRALLSSDDDDDGDVVVGRVRQIAAGRDFVLARAEGGRVWAWGRVDGLALGLPAPALASRYIRFLDGACPRGAKTLVRARPLDRLGASPAVGIAAGPGHAFAVTAAGEVYAWGAGGGWRLGTGAPHDVATPVKLEFGRLPGPRHFARRVSAGDEWACFLTELR